MAGIGLVGAAREQEQQPPAGEPPRQIAERVERRGVAPVQVVDEHDAGRSAVDGERDQLAHRLEEPQPGAGILEARGGRLAELGQQARGLAGAVRRQLGAARLDGGPQELRHHAVGQAALAGRRARGDRRRAAIVQGGDEILSEAGLAHARLALDHGHAPVGGDTAVQIGQRPPRAGASDQRLGGGRDRGRHLGDGRAAALVHGVVELGRLGERPHAELTVEHAHALAVLAHGIAAAAARGVAGDQAAVGGLVQRVERQPLLGPGHGLVPPAGRHERIDEPVERRRPLAADALGGQLQPVVEGRARADREPGEQVAAVQIGGGRERVGAGRRVGGDAAELGQVEPAAGECEGDRAAVDVEEAAAQGGAQGRERPPQGRPRAVDVELRPEQRRHHLAALRMPGDGQVGEHGRGLARVDLERPAVDFHDRRAEK